MYKFYTTTQDNIYTEINNLTKRQAVIRFNKAQREIGYSLKECGWELIKD